MRVPMLNRLALWNGLPRDGRLTRRKGLYGKCRWCQRRLYWQKNDPDHPTDGSWNCARCDAPDRSGKPPKGFDPP